MKRTDPKSIADIIDEALSNSGGADQLARQRASFAWSEIVGPGVNRYTFKRFVDGSTLHVFITSAPLKHELSFHKQRLIELINNAVGKNVITDISIH
ncbi:MAG: DUF721 domain-containing protein [Muribaculaceae bacterium]|jgi:hypothetical protein|nr:DUF721 domain-containing protein [Muribaculaceae bacterium]